MNLPLHLFISCKKEYFKDRGRFGEGGIWMRLERLNQNKFKVILTDEDMSERGISKDDLWKDLPKVRDLFRDMMIEADDVLGFKIDGPVAVEVYTMPAQGMIIIVTKEFSNDPFDIDDFEEGYIEMQVTIDETKEIMYEFSDIEHVIQLCPRLYNISIYGGSLYFYESKYYIVFSDYDFIEEQKEGVVSLLSEFGTPSTLSIVRLQEYGKELITGDAVLRMYRTFYEVMYK